MLGFWHAGAGLNRYYLYSYQRMRNMRKSLFWHKKSQRARPCWTELAD